MAPNPIDLYGLVTSMAPNLIDLYGLVTSMAPNPIDLYGLVTSMAPNPIDLYGLVTSMAANPIILYGSAVRHTPKTLPTHDQHNEKAKKTPPSHDTHTVPPQTALPAFEAAITNCLLWCPIDGQTNRRANLAKPSNLQGHRLFPFHYCRQKHSHRNTDSKIEPRGKKPGRKPKENYQKAWKLRDTAPT